MDELIRNLTNRGFNILTAKDEEEALKLAKEFIDIAKSIGLGGSTSVKECGVLEYITNLKDKKVFNQYEKGITTKENLKRRKEGLLSDLYVTSCNAITIDGALVNCDGAGNRVAAMIFGPNKVLLIVGKNKIVKDKHAAFRRIREVAVPKNIDRMNKIAVENGKEPYHNEKIVARKYTIIEGDEEGRINIILVDKELGF